ncbi:ATPase [Trichinella spiralis]|uniref:ATPase n=1 Tax=Trichinella spiralis TaxID=6334 RepID=UPI0001EFBEF9|nr:ATPase [Trichinella spiralis]
MCELQMSDVQRYVIHWLERISSNFMLINVTCLFSSFVHDKILFEDVRYKGVMNQIRNEHQF